MAFDLSGFSPEQWHFLAVLKALETPVPIEIIGTLVPLPPVPLFDLIRRATQFHILQKSETDVFAIAPNLPSEISAHLLSMNTPAQISRLMDQLTTLNLLDSIDPGIVIELLLQAQRGQEASLMQLSLAEKAIIHQDVDKALHFSIRLVDQHPRPSIATETDSRLVALVLSTSDLCMAHGKGFPEILPLLQKAGDISDALGDKRSRALIDLHIGRLLYFFNQHAESFASLSAGKQSAELLGDDDILNRTVGFFGLYHFIQGDYKKALTYFETAVEQTRLSENDITNPFAPVFFSLSALAFYQFDRAFTILDIFHRKAEQDNLFGAASFLRAVLGYILLRCQKEKEAMTHLAIAQKNAGEQGNALALYWVRLFMTYYEFVNGNLTEARRIFVHAIQEAAASHIGPAFSAFPWIMDMLLEFEQQKIPRIPDCNLDTVAEFLARSPSLPVKGYLYRILARRAAIKQAPVEERQSYLENSFKYFEHTGFRVELSKTLIEMARLELSKGNRDKAQVHAQEAWRDLPVYAEHYFPNDLQPLVQNVSKGPFLKSFISPEIVLNRFADILERVIPASDLKVLLNRLVTATNLFFGAERGGLFVFETGPRQVPPQLLGAVNLTEIETASENFQPQIKLMTETLRKKRPFLGKIPISSVKTSSSKTISVISLPLHLEKGRQGVLYHDNSTLVDSFDFLDDSALLLLKTHLESLCRRIWEYGLSAQKEKTRISEASIDPAIPTKESIICHSPVFTEVLKKADRIANADYPVLIQGETGVGKEVMAHWIHQKGPRHDGPYVVIDSTTITENLLESELFGHEKGAFTGADRQKPGRVELAAGGTLFLDEVGELPLSIQAKLLRVLEEKTFTRVGGNRVRQCDFRLIAATNRDLADEVRAGRFREDLFYRLNVLPLQIPPLRNRKEDIIPLARHFLEISCKRLKRIPPPIVPVDISALLAYPWPGNIRELKNIIERGALLSDGSHLELQLTVTAADQQPVAFETLPTISELQRQYIAYVLKTTEGRISGPRGAVQILGINRSTLYSRMKKLGMLPEEEDQGNPPLASSG